ncbi:MAG TPA: MFS transporter [Streptosporangiaceae bacterium]
MRRPREVLARGALRSRNFRLLAGCDVISGTGNAVAFVAIPFAVLAIGGSAADVGYVATAAMIPMIVFMLLGGVAGDRFPRHKVIVIANSAQALAQGVAAGLVFAHQAHVWELLVLAAVRGTGLGFYFPAAQGLLPQTVPEEDRAQANAISRIGRNSSGIAGAALGGLLVGAAGPAWGLAVDAASFAAAAALRAGMRFPPMPPDPDQESTLHQLREGWREFAARRWLWAIVGEFTIMTAVIAGTIDVLGPVVADRQLGGASAWGVILAGYGAGAVIGGLIMVRLRPQRMLAVASAAAGVFAALLFALAVPLPAAATTGVAVIVGVTSEIFAVNWVTTMQQEIPARLMSRLSAYDALGSFALAPVGVAAAGPIALAFGTPATLTAGGVIIIALTFAVLGVPEVRSMRRRPAADRPTATPDQESEPAAPGATPLPAEPG